MADEELLDVGRRTQWPRWLAAAIVGGLGAVAGFALRGHDSPGPSPTRTTIVTASPSVPPDTRSAALALVFDAAHGGVPAPEQLDPSHQCVRPPGAADVVGLVSDPVSVQLPAYVITDVTRTVDGRGGLCRVDLRGDRLDGTVLVVRVLAPIEDARVLDVRQDAGASTVDGVTTQFVRVTSRDGWIVTVGTTGQAGDSPPAKDLLDLAQDAALHW